MGSRDAWAGITECVGLVVDLHRTLLSGETEKQDNNPAQKQLGSEEISTIQSHYMNHHFKVWEG